MACVFHMAMSGDQQLSLLCECRGTAAQHRPESIMMCWVLNICKLKMTRLLVKLIKLIKLEIWIDNLRPNTRCRGKQNHRKFAKKFLEMPWVAMDWSLGWWNSWSATGWASECYKIILNSFKSDNTLDDDLWRFAHRHGDRVRSRGRNSWQQRRLPRQSCSWSWLKEQQSSEFRALSFRWNPGHSWILLQNSLSRESLKNCWGMQWHHWIICDPYMMDTCFARRLRSWTCLGGLVKRGSTHFV